MKKITFYFFAVLLIFAGVFSLEARSQGIDWGDAPDPAYPTLGANNGANHMIIPGMHLGVSVDPENDGQVMAGFAHGDDLNGNDDADGVIFNSWIQAGQNATVIVIASMPGVLNAWIDFNADGDWADANEHVFVDYLLNPGNNNLTFTAPVALASGMPTYTRFRFSTAALLQFLGPAPDGEVEDYQLMLGAPTTGDIFIDPDPTMTLVQNEISMAMIPGEGFDPPSLLIAAYNDEPFPGGPGMGVSYSTDQGATWSNTHLQYPVNVITGAVMVDMFDPSIAIDDSGHVFVAEIATDANWMTGPSTGLYVHKSVDGGLTWNPPVTVSIEGPPGSTSDTAYRLNDRDQICSDRYEDSPYYNNIYITWIQDRGWGQSLPYSDIYFSYSTDGGNNWSQPHRINSWANNMGNMPVPDVAKDGTVYVVWMDYNVQSGGQGVIFLDKSLDGGISWGPDIAVDTIDLPPLHLNGNTDTRAKGAAVVKVLPSDPAELYIIYAADPDGQGQDEADIFFIKSSDTGNTWSVPLRVNDDATPNDQILPWMYVKPNGIIDVCWYDRRNDLSDFDFDVYFAHSTDGGVSFSPNVQVNMQMFPPPFVIKTGDAWIGEYMSLVADHYSAYMIYSSSLNDGLGDLVFVIAENPEFTTDMGDAPDNALAYPSSGTIGSFPTCIGGSNTGQYIIHYPQFVWLGPTFDHETDGNGGLCSPFGIPYDNDECIQDNDAGLVIPLPYTITGPAGQEQIAPCSGNASFLDTVCSVVHWGTEIDIQINNGSQDNAFMNILIDWNQDGLWAYNSATKCNSTVVPEHVLVDFAIPAGYNGLLSALTPQVFMAGPNTGYVWSRFTISDAPVGNDWHGQGEFLDGETEDYLLEIVLDVGVNEYPGKQGELRFIPNPARDNALIGFHNPEQGKTSLVLYNLTGICMDHIINKHYPSGSHEIIWNRIPDPPSGPTPGVYVLEHRLNGNLIDRIKVVLE